MIVRIDAHYNVELVCQICKNELGINGSCIDLYGTGDPHLDYTTASTAFTETQIRNTVLAHSTSEQPTAPTHGIDLGSRTIINCAEPVSASDVATKTYADTKVSSSTGIVDGGTF